SIGWFRLRAVSGVNCEDLDKIDGIDELQERRKCQQ
ncbi:hypothetical protein NPIL_396911, partial [Nephila pilipes]